MRAYFQHVTNCKTFRGLLYIFSNGMPRYCLTKKQKTTTRRKFFNFLYFFLPLSTPLFFAAVCNPVGVENEKVCLLLFSHSKKHRSIIPFGFFSTIHSLFDNFFSPFSPCTFIMVTNTNIKKFSVFLPRHSFVFYSIHGRSWCSGR